MSNYGDPPSDPYGTPPSNPYGEQPQGSYGQGSQVPTPGPGAAPTTGFFGALFDFSFNHFITPMVVKVVYALIVVVMSLTFLVFLVGGFMQSTVLGVLVLVFGPIVFLLYLCFFRMTLEFYVAIVRMSEDINHRLPPA